MPLITGTYHGDGRSPRNEMANASGRDFQRDNPIILRKDRLPYETSDANPHSFLRNSPARARSIARLLDLVNVRRDTRFRATQWRKNFTWIFKRLKFHRVYMRDMLRDVEIFN